MMVRFFIIFAALGFSACGPPPLYVTADGVSVFASETGVAYPKSDVERALLVVRQRFAEATSLNERELMEQIAGLSIYIEDAPVLTPSGQPVRGYYLPNAASITVSPEACLGATALPHELIHAYHQPFFGPSGDHPARYFGGAGTPEQIAWHQLFEETCLGPEILSE